MINARTLLTAAVLSTAVFAHAQIPDLLTAFDAGGRSMGMGSSLGVTDTGTSSVLNNPAGIGYSGNRIEVGFHNLTESSTTIANDFNNPDFNTSGHSGGRTLSHVGFTKEMAGGVVGFSYTLAGYIHDQRTGTNLANGNLQVRNFREQIKAKTDMFTLSYGRASRDQSTSFGFGVIAAMQNVSDFQAYDLFRQDNTQIPTTPLDISGSSVGIGLVAGVQMTPPGNPNLTVGASVRSPISLSGGGAVSGYYKRIPGKLSLGFANRFANPGRSKDFILWGLEGDLYFGGQSTGILSRNKSQAVVGTGIEYFYRFRDRAYIPIRLGYRNVQSGGTGFSAFNALTFGVGYQPDGAAYGFDLDFASSSAGGMDMSLTLSYRLGK